MPQDDVPCRMLTLLMELLRVPDRVPRLAVAGAWEAARLCVYRRDAMGPLALELGLFDLAATHLRVLGSGASDWLVSVAKCARVLVGLVHIPRCPCHVCSAEGVDAKPYCARGCFRGFGLHILFVQHLYE